MSTRDAIRKEQVPPEYLAEAGVWIARLHGDDRTQEVESGFRQWLRADPMNAKAFELTTEAWDDSRNLRRVVPFAHDIPSSATRRAAGPRVKGPWLIATAASVLMIAGVFYEQAMGVSTDVGERRLLTLEDGTRVYLNTATRVVVSYDTHRRKVILKGGEALFEVAQNPDLPFIVQVGEREVQALGTSFTVRYEDARTTVALMEGKVVVGSVLLAPGQRLTLRPDTPPKIDTPVMNQVIAWRKGQVVLDDMMLSHAVEEMNRYSATKLMIARPEAAGLLVNGLFQAGDSENFANAVAQTYGLDVVRSAGQITLEGLPLPAPRSAN